MMIHVVGFMALALPILFGGLQLAGTLSIDSQIKNDIAKAQYTEIGALEYAHWLLADEERLDRWQSKTGGQETIELNGHEITITNFGSFLDIQIPALEYAAIVDKEGL